MVSTFGSAHGKVAAVGEVGREIPEAKTARPPQTSAFAISSPALMSGTHDLYQPLRR